MLALDRLGLTPARYLSELQALVVDLLRDYDIPAVTDEARPGVWARGRSPLHVGVSIRNGVSCFGVILNVDPDLEPFHDVICDGSESPMTSMQRETPSRIRVASVRQRFVELVAARFGFARVSVFHNYDGALPQPMRHATIAGTRSS